MDTGGCQATSSCRQIDLSHVTSSTVETWKEDRHKHTRSKTETGEKKQAHTEGGRERNWISWSTKSQNIWNEAPKARWEKETGSLDGRCVQHRAAWVKREDKEEKLGREGGTQFKHSCAFGTTSLWTAKLLFISYSTLKTFPSFDFSMHPADFVKSLLRNLPITSGSPVPLSGNSKPSACLK